MILGYIARLIFASLSVLLITFSFDVNQGVIFSAILGAIIALVLVASKCNTTISRLHLKWRFLVASFLVCLGVFGVAPKIGFALSLFFGGVILIMFLTSETFLNRLRESEVRAQHLRKIEDEEAARERGRRRANGEEEDGEDDTGDEEGYINDFGPARMFKPEGVQRMFTPGRARSVDKRWSNHSLNIFRRPPKRGRSFF